MYIPKKKILEIKYFFEYTRYMYINLRLFLRLEEKNNLKITLFIATDFVTIARKNFKLRFFKCLLSIV